MRAKNESTTSGLELIFFLKGVNDLPFIISKKRKRLVECRPMIRLL
jgi:hypothetical protein